MPVPPLVAEALRAVDGRRTVAEIAAIAAGEGGADEDDLRAVGEALFALDAFFLLDTPRARARIDLMRERRTPPGFGPVRPLDDLGPGDLSFLPGARTTCDGKGDCCRAYELVSISTRDMERLLAHDWRGVVPGVERNEDVLVRREARGQNGLVLAQREGHCTFLDTDGFCIVHKKAGPPAKPNVCRAFPILGMRRPDGGVDISMRFECSCVARFFRTGTPLAEQAEEIAELLRDPDGPVRSLPALVKITPVAAVPSTFLRSLDVAALGVLADETRSPDEQVVALGRLAFSAGARLGALPEVGAIDALGAAIAQADPASLFGEPPPGARPEAAAAALANVLLALADASGREYFWSGAIRVAADRRAAHEEFVTGILLLARRIVEALDLPVALPPFEHCEVGEVEAALDDPGVADVLREWLRNEVFGKNWTFAPDYVSAVGEIIVRYVLVRWGSKRLALARGAGRVSTDDVISALVTANRQLRFRDGHRRAFDASRDWLHALCANPLPFEAGLV
jgi:hypothetical protein